MGTELRISAEEVEVPAELCWGRGRSPEAGARGTSLPKSRFSDVIAGLDISQGESIYTTGAINSTNQGSFFSPQELVVKHLPN